MKNTSHEYFSKHHTDYEQLYRQYIDRFRNAVKFVIRNAESVPVYTSLVDATLKVESLERESNNKANKFSLKRLHRLLTGNVLHIKYRQTSIWEFDLRALKPTHPRHENNPYNTICSIWSHEQLRE